VTGRFGELHAVPDDRFEVLTLEVTVELIDDRLHEGRSARIERDEHTGVDMVTRLPVQQVERLQELADPVQREEARIHRDDGFRAGLECIERQEANGRGAIDDDIVVVASYPGKRFGQEILPPGEPRQLLRDRAQKNVGRSHVEVVENREDDVTKVAGLLAHAPRENLVHRLRRRDSVAGAETQGGMALWVHVHQQHPALRAREECREVYGCGGLAASTLLVHDRDRPHTSASSFF
jgi:hypothetical protein